MQAETKQYESRHRLTWAARYPLKPGRDVASRRGLLLLIADTAITGEYWMSQEKLADQLGLTARGVRKKLAKLCSEGVLRAQHRGYRQTNIYTLMRLGEVAQHGDFLPLSDRNSSSSKRFDRNSSSTHDRNSSSKVTGTPVPPKEAIREEDITQEAAAAGARALARAKAAQAVAAPPQKPKDAARPAAAAADSDSSTIPKEDQTAARHTCTNPKCENTWPKHFGAVCYKCQRDVELAQRREKFWAEQEKRAEQEKQDDERERLYREAHPPAPPPPVSKTTRRLRAASARGESWLNHQGLDQLIGNRDLEEVCELMYAMGGRMLPEPEDFFEEYDRHLQEHKQLEADYLAPFPSPANNGTSGGLVPIGEALAGLPGTAQARLAA